MSGFKLYRSRIILALSSQAYKRAHKLSSQTSTEPEFVDQPLNKQIKLNDQSFIKIQQNEQKPSNSPTQNIETQKIIQNLQKTVTNPIQNKEKQENSTIKIPLQNINSINHNNSQTQNTTNQNTIVDKDVAIQASKHEQKKELPLFSGQNKQQSNNSSLQLQQQQQIKQNGHQMEQTNKAVKKEIKYFKACGLHNIGNTCYFNSALQCIINTPKFNDKFLSDEIKQELNPKHKQVALQYWRLLKQMRTTNNTSENPVQLKQAISSSTKKFGGHRQEDSQEFLRALLTCLHEDLNRVTGKPIYKELTADLNKQSLEDISNTWFNYFKGRDNSLVTDYFTGQLLSRVTCSVCKNQSLAFDNFQDLSLAFPNISGNQITLEDMLKYYLSEENINQYTCGKCRQQRKCTRQLEIWRLPDILVIHLKRFYYKGPMKKKINIEIKFGAKLDLGQFIINSSDKSTLNCNYNLYGIVKHYGDLNFGHYFAECKHPFTMKWYQLNDSSVQEIKPKVSYESDNSAYLLLYSRI
ncbi:unnamed protein product [Paramecium octaurelia]|uniref:Ubiquitin carboxyl-terminal hydrolase n=1 Tax=Paramecium octaurelia TaxID=43137 RepID=A0A8S1SH47_PAROT|nr:unnamed protein product [Paramecium octaurelia]